MFAQATVSDEQYLASADALGKFDVFALQGQANTIWTDNTFQTRFFTNVPDGTDMVKIGEVDVTPEPTSLALFALGFGVLVAARRHQRKKNGAEVSEGA